MSAQARDYQYEKVYVFDCNLVSYIWFVFPVFSPNTGKYGREITPYLDTFHAVIMIIEQMRVAVPKGRENAVIFGLIHFTWPT